MTLLAKLLSLATGKAQPLPDSEARTNNLNLLRAIDALAMSDSPQNRRALYEAALKAWFLVPTQCKPVPGPAGEYVLSQETAVSLPAITDAHGNKVVPCFSDEQALAHWAGPSPWFALQGSAFFQTVAKTDAQLIAVNPFTSDKHPIRPTGRFTRAEFEALAGGLIPRMNWDAQAMQISVKQPGSIRVSAPGQMPGKELLQALAAAAKSQESVKALYFAEVTFDRGSPHSAVAIELSERASQRQIDEAVRALGSAVRPLLAAGQPFDFFPGSTLLDAFRTHGTAIYVASPH